MYQLASPEVDAGKSEVECGSVTAFPHGFKEGPLGSVRIFFSRDLSFGPELTAQPKVAAEGARQFFMFNQKCFEVPMSSHIGFVQHFQAFFLTGKVFDRLPAGFIP